LLTTLAAFERDLMLERQREGICERRSDERRSSALTRAQYPTDVGVPLVFWRRRYKVTRRGDPGRDIQRPP
jgi:hypothetical protein